jgi:hypothetical protein
VAIYARAVEVVFYDYGGTLLVTMVFGGGGKQSGVDIGVLQAGERASESTMFGGGVGRGCLNCDTRAAALATVLPRLYIGCCH